MQSTTNEIKLETAKDFNADRDALYRAWTEPEALKLWWRPMGNRLINVVNELREGGTVRYEFGNESGDHAFTITGQYDRVEEGALLSYSWNWEIQSDAVNNAAFHLTIRFEEREGGSRLSVTQDNFESDESVHPHREGWEKSLEDLRSYLEAK